MFLAALFAGAAIYINVVEHPARISCGTELALREFAPSYRRATVMQVFLAVAGCITGTLSASARRDLWPAVGAFLLGVVVPFTLIVILPTNNQLLDPALNPDGEKASALLVRWGRLHAIRSILSAAAFVVFLFRLGTLDFPRIAQLATHAPASITVPRSGSSLGDDVSFRRDTPGRGHRDRAKSQ
jgi:hypothetical protein